MTERMQTRGPYRVGEETRRALLNAALRLFGSNGYDATSTRAICADAGVSIPAIAYHFGSKEALHLACADHVVQFYRSRMGAAVADASAGLRTLSPELARDRLEEIMLLLLSIAEEGGGSEPWLAFMLNEMSRPGLAHDRMLADLWLPGLALVSALMAVVRGKDRPGGAERADALLLLSSLSAITTSARIATTFLSGPDADGTVTEELARALRRWIATL